MAPEERVEQLIEQGCVIAVAVPDGPSIELTLAGALWLTKPKRLRWCAIFPEHQSHVHETRYSRVVLDNDGRDVLLYQGSKLVAGIVPYIESGLDPDDVRDALVRWRDLLGKYNNKAQFEEFLGTA